MPIVAALYLAASRASKKPALALLILGTLIYYPVLASAGSGGGRVDSARETSSRAASQSPTREPAKLELTKLELTNTSWELVDAETLDITGSTEPGASLSANWSGGSSTATADSNGAFTVQVGPFGDEGEIVITISAGVTGKQSQTTRTNVRRTISEGKFKLMAETIPYDQLKKDPDSLIGRIVTYKANVFQYDARTTTSNMLASVTDKGYGFWDDQVLLNLDPALGSNVDEDDLIQFWGTVTGSYTYETAIGGSNTVPRILARYLTLTKKQ